MADQFNWNITIDYVPANQEWEATVESDYGPSYVAHNVYELVTAIARDLRTEVGDKHHTEFIPKGYVRLSTETPHHE